MIDKPRDYCGIFGIQNHPDAALLTYYGLHALQHRGQESAGIVTSYFDEDKERWIMPAHRDFGLVLNVFDDQNIFKRELQGRAAIGHNRYSTTGAAKNPANIQPFRVHYHEGNIAIGHNGNLANAKQLRDRFRQEGVLFQSTSDTELILHLISHSPKKTQIEQVLDALDQIEGAYSLMMLTDDKLIAVRDPNGFRPLALGKVDGSYCVSSETCAFDIIDAEYIRDIEPGEVLVIDQNGGSDSEPESYHLDPEYGTDTSQCIFEFVYFSRPDSKIFGENVDKVRRNLGKYLAKEHPINEVIRNAPDDKKPIVISVPDSSNTAALGYVHENQKFGHECKFEIGLIRNHYVGRTFISPGQKSREQKVRTKFNTVKGVIEGRSVIIVDDSIVRGTTSRYLVNMIRQADPAEIHFLVSSPPIISPCYYGMDFPSPEELMANRFDRDIEEMAKEIGVDSLRYLSPDGLVNAVKEANISDHGYCTACFTENYPVPVNFGVEKEENEIV
ncbi:amidophosphoribosyltransferase [Aliifodinibius salicampi]|uniref:Amidophosphoribosyltransferase n=1 Tax=Fodinibius salicampi TaxID=1920655 RepID=A0ABT3Q231_9BACT|nr:amidophosphoribosyltransferase [Fodinibius salicampi]MCW9714165.1 amidophosphoribosyltransferase [Fodinibius salicampi]